MVRLELIDHRRRERVVLAPRQFTVDHVSEQKAGGTALPIGAAIFEGFLQGRQPGDLSFFDGTALTEVDERGIPLCPSTRDPACCSDYEDVTTRTVDELLEAERWAEPSDFPPMEYDMGHAIGFLARLREIWNEKRAGAG